MKGSLSGYKLKAPWIAKEHFPRRNFNCVNIIVQYYLTGNEQVQCCLCGVKIEGWDISSEITAFGVVRSCSLSKFQSATQA